MPCVAHPPAPLAALRAHAAHYSIRGSAGADGDSTGIDQDHVHVLIAAPDRLPPLSAAIEVAVYRIVQQALTNVVRHAPARRCRIRMMVTDRLELEITDDGAGLRILRSSEPS